MDEILFCSRGWEWRRGHVAYSFELEVVTSLLSSKFLKEYRNSILLVRTRTLPPTMFTFNMFQNHQGRIPDPVAASALSVHVGHMLLAMTPSCCWFPCDTAFLVPSLNSRNQEPCLRRLYYRSRRVILGSFDRDKPVSMKGFEAFQGVVFCAINVDSLGAQTF